MHNFETLAPHFIDQLRNGGALLTVTNGLETNTMTIGWGTIGVIWNKPIMMVAVRYSRHTYPMLELAGEFTVSVPATGEMRDILRFAGTKSGRDVDKFAECNLTAVAGESITTPIIGEAQDHFECKVVYQQVMEPGMLDAELQQRFYRTGDYHVLYYGEIVNSYQL